MPTFLDSNGAKQLVAEVKALVDRDYKTSAEVAEDVNRLKDEVADHTEDINQLKDEDTDQKSAIEDLQDLTNRKAGALVDTASGAIASFVPDSTIDNLLGVSVAVEPVQDLHGYDSPWPGGGGKNLFNANALTNTQFSNNGIIATVSNGTITFNGTATANAFFSIGGTGLPSGNYVFSFNNPVASSGFHVSFRNSGDQYFTDVAADAANRSTVFTGEPTTIILYVKSGATLTNFVVKPQLETGSTPTAWTPYSNICPISGWDAAGIGNSASNLIDASAVANGFLKPTDGVVYNNQNWNVTPFIPARGGDYTLSWESAVSTYQGTICAYDQDQHYITGVNWSGSAFSHTFTLPFGTSYIKASWSVVVSGNPATRNNIRLNFGSADLGYTPFISGNTYTIQLGQTVYGGTLDVVTGVLKVDRAKKSGMTRGYKDSSNKLYRIADLIDVQRWIEAGSAPPIISTALPTLGLEAARQSASPCITQYGMVIFAGGYIGNESELDTLLQTLEIVYNLATPIVYDLTPQQIETIKGQINNVWADAGDVAVEFAADIKAYIDNKIAAAVAALS